MAEQTTETTQTQQTTTPPVTTPPVTTEQGTVGATTTPAPSQTSTEQTTTQTQTTTGTPAQQVQTPPPLKLSPEEVQKRIDRMYARLQEERKRRLAAEAQTRLGTGTTTTEEGTEEGEETIVKPLTEADVEAVVDRRERGKKMMESEIHVFERHPTALNEDGSFNMSDPFVQKYVEIGRTNPALAVMDNGPELAEAMADKMLGVDYKKGRQAEAARTTQTANSFTTTSTTALLPVTTTPQLSPVEQKIARRMRMSDKEYSDYRASNKVTQKSWEVKSR